MWSRRGPTFVTTSLEAIIATSNPPRPARLGAIVLATLADKIASGELAPGTTLPTELALCQAFGVYGFSNWVPALLVEKGINVTKSLQYSFIIAVAYPLAPLLAATFADRFERKWIICGAAAAISVFGLGFAQFSGPVLLIASGVLVTGANMTLSYAYHAYQTEVFPTAIRARAAGLVYSMSRLSATFSGFIVAFMLREAGVGGVFGLITAAMVIVIVTIALWGPTVRGKPLDA